MTNKAIARSRNAMRMMSSPIPEAERRPIINAIDPAMKISPRLLEVR